MSALRQKGELVGLDQLSTEVYSWQSTYMCFVKNKLQLVVCAGPVFSVFVSPFCVRFYNIGTMSISPCNNEMMSEVAKCFGPLEHL